MQTGKRDFDMAAANWDENPGRVKVATEVFQAIQRAIPLSPSMCALDFGCGTGLVTLQLAQHVGRVMGVDSSRGMLDVLDRKIAEYGVEDVATRFLDLDAGDSLTGTYDLVVASMTLHHVPDTQSLLVALASILNPGGLLCITDLDCEDADFHDDNTGVFHFGFERDSLRTQFAQAGLAEIADATATIVRKPGKDGIPKEFPVFLMTGIRCG